MKAKQRIEAAIQEYSERKRLLRSEMAAVQTDTRYADAYRKRLMEDKQRELTAACEAFLRQCSSVIGSVRAEATQKQKAFEKRKTSSEYQICLSNAVQLLRLGAYKLTVDQIRANVLPFADDELAIAAFHGAMTESGMTGEYATMVLQPIKDHERLLSALDGLETSLMNACQMNPVYGMNLEEASLGVILSRWNDDLTTKEGIYQ